MTAKLAIAAALSALLAASTVPAAAAVYKCPLPQGGHEYRQQPCPDGTGDEVELPGTRRAAPAGGDTAAGALVGSWRTSKEGVRVDVQMTSDGRFHGTAHEGGSTVWTYGGRYEHDDDAVTWILERSSLPLSVPLPSRETTPILAVDREGFSVREPSGATTTYRRR